MEAAVIVFDICSSTTIVEDLNANGNIDKYEILVKEIDNFLVLRERQYNFEKYKFLGDGYILIAKNPTNAGNLVRFTTELTVFMNHLVQSFLNRHVSQIELPRFGITVGIDIGQVSPILKGQEYIGRPINLAARLQGSLKDPGTENSLLVSLRFFNALESEPIRDSFIARQRTFRNISGDRPIRCFEFKMLESVVKKRSIKPSKDYTSIYGELKPYKSIFD